MVANQVFARAILRERAALASLRALMVDAGDFEVLEETVQRYLDASPSFIATRAQQCTSAFLLKHFWTMLGDPLLRDQLVLPTYRQFSGSISLEAEEHPLHRTWVAMQPLLKKLMSARALHYLNKLSQDIAQHQDAYANDVVHNGDFYSDGEPVLEPAGNVPRLQDDQEQSIMVGYNWGWYVDEMRFPIIYKDCAICYERMKLVPYDTSLLTSDEQQKCASCAWSPIYDVSDVSRFKSVIYSKNCTSHDCFMHGDCYNRWKEHATPDPLRGSSHERVKKCPSCNNTMCGDTLESFFWWMLRTIFPLDSQSTYPRLLADWQTVLIDSIV